MNGNTEQDILNTCRANKDYIRRKERKETKGHEGMSDKEFKRKKGELEREY